MNDTLIPQVIPNLKDFDAKIFEGIVGQDNPKRAFDFYLNSYQATRVMPHIMLVAPKGQGKTRIARAVAKGLYQYDDEGQVIWKPSKTDANKLVPKRKSFLEINCSTLKNVKQFINGVVVPLIQDKDVTVFFDEASEIPHDISMALLTILEPNSTHRTQFSFDEYVCEFDFRRQSFIFATTESQKVFCALADRMERITLQEYSALDLANIIKLNLKDVTISDELLLEISSVLRGNARAAQKMSEKIKAYLKGALLFRKEDWNNLKGILSITPLGLNPIEIQILRILQSRPEGTSLTALSAKTGMTAQQLRQDSELYLLKHSLLDIENTGRHISTLGQKYLDELDGKSPSATL